MWWRDVQIEAENWKGGRRPYVKHIILEEKMNYAKVTRHLGKSLKTNVWHKLPFQNWRQAEKPASFELAFRQLKLASCL